MKNEKTRQSGIELLRILAACAVVVLHYNDGRAFVYVNSIGTEAHKFILFLLESIGICAVDLFMIITGYFMCKNQKRSLLRPLELYAEIVLLKEAYYVLITAYKYVSTGVLEFSLKTFLNNFVFKNYFLIFYIVVYFISPFINILLERLDKKQWRQMMLVLFLAFSIYAVGVDLYQEIFNVEPMGISPITAWGNKQGFNIVNFVFMYIIGAFLKYHEEELSLRLPGQMTLLILWIANVAVLVGWGYLAEVLSNHGLRSGWVYHNPFVILSAVLLFIMFNRMVFQNRVVNGLAKASFTCYLFHGYVLNYVGIEWAVGQSVIVMLMHILIIVAVIYILSWCVYKIFTLCTDRFFNLLSKTKLFQTFVI